MKKPLYNFGETVGTTENGRWTLPKIFKIGVILFDKNLGFKYGEDIPIFKESDLTLIDDLGGEK